MGSDAVTGVLTDVGIGVIVCVDTGVGDESKQIAVEISERSSCIAHSLS